MAVETMSAPEAASQAAIAPQPGIPRPATAVSVGEGRSAPLGATLSRDGVNFSVFAKHATLIELLLFDDVNAVRPSRVVALEARTHRTYHYWHALVPNLAAGQVYAYRAHGPFAPERGLRFDSEKVLIDPYGLAVAVPDAYERAAARRPGDNAAVAMKSVVTDRGSYDWDGDEPLRRPFVETVIYELHVRGFTRHPSSGVAPERSGTYAGLMEKIPYLRDLGVTAVELLPVFQFDPGCPGRQAELLGIPAGVVFRAASRLQLAPPPAGSRR